MSKIRTPKYKYTLKGEKMGKVKNRPTLFVDPIAPEEEKFIGSLRKLEQMALEW